MRILIIDDSRSSLALLASVVSALPDVEIITRTNPLEALALCTSEQFDLVLVDHIMRWRPEFVRGIGRRNGDFVVIPNLEKIFETQGRRSAPPAEERAA